MSSVILAHTTLPENFLTRFGVQVDPELLVTALTHRSFAHENQQENNERLEFLGDAVLELVVTDAIFEQFEDRREGSLTNIRAALVSEPPLAKIAKKIGLDHVVLLGKGEEKQNGCEKPSILSDAFEAVVATVYLSCGLEKAREFILSFLQPEIDLLKEQSEPIDYKAKLQTLASETNVGEPLYEYTSQGAEHEAKHTCVISFSSFDLLRTSATASSRKKAAQEAARLACQKLEEMKQLKK